MGENNGNRRHFLKKAFSVAGVSVLPGSVSLIADPLKGPSRVVEFVTRFPKALTLEEYRNHKTDFENKDKVTTLVSVFKKSGKMVSENFAFHGTHSCWRVEFQSDAAFQEWMNLTEELESHKDTVRETAGFNLEIRILA